MTPKQTRFVAEYLKDLNATRAARRAGYSKKTAHSCGPRLLENAGVKAAIAAKTEKRLEKNNLTAERVLEEMRRLAFSDLRGFYDAKGNLIPIHKLTDEQGAALASHETIMKNATAGDGKVDRVLKLRLHDKVKALDMLGKHFGLLLERVEHSGNVTFEWQAPESK